MGGSSSKNYVTQVTNNLISAVNTTAQSCQQIVSQQQLLNITGGKGNVNIGDVNFGQRAALNLNCIQSADYNNNLSQTLNEKVQQSLSSLNQALSFTVSETKSVTNLINNLAIAIRNAATQSCAQQAIQQQIFQIQGQEGNINIGSANFQQDITSLVQCVQNSQAVNQAQQDLTTFLDSKTKSENQNVIGSLGSLFSGFGGIIAIIVIIIVVVIIAVIIYFVISSRKKNQITTTTTRPVVFPAGTAPLPPGALPAPPSRPATPLSTAILPAPPPRPTTLPSAPSIPTVPLPRVPLPKAPLPPPLRP